MSKRPYSFIGSILCMASLVLLVQGCSKHKGDGVPNEFSNNYTYTISASLKGSEEVPANGSTGTGTVTGTYNNNTNTLKYQVNWSGLSGSATLGHFHGPALPGVNANAVINLTLNNNGSSGSASGTVILTDAQQNDLLAGKWYANIHTINFSAGEIRGQVSAVQ